MRDNYKKNNTDLRLRWLNRYILIINIKMKTMKTKIFTLILIVSIFYSCKKDSLPSTLNDGLVAYYPFNGNANDESGNNNNATVYGAVLTTDRFGNPDKAYLLNGTDNYIKVENPTGLINLNYTYSFWLKILQLPQMYNCNFIMELGYPNMQGHAFAINNCYPYNNQTTGWSYNCATSANSGINFQTGFLPLRDVWYNIVVVKSNESVSFYENNTLIQEVLTNGNDAYYTNPIDIYFGARALLWQSFFLNGIFDDIRIYDRVLTPDERKELLGLGL
jgi:hypothetical protein